MDSIESFKFEEEKNNVQSSSISILNSQKDLDINKSIEDIKKSNNIWIPNSASADEEDIYRRPHRIK